MTGTAQGVRFCTVCGTERQSAARFCRVCGAQILAAAPAATPIAPTLERVEAEAFPLVAGRTGSRRKAGPLPVVLVAGGVVSFAVLMAGYSWIKTRPVEPLGDATIAPSSTLSASQPTLQPVAPLTAPTDLPIAAAGYADARTYCRVVGSIDQPDGRYRGLALPDWIAQAVGYSPGGPGYLTWRCKDGQVLACVNGGGIGPCDKRDTSTQPNEAMFSFCRDNPMAQVIPASSIGNSTVYAWACQDSVPVATRQISFTDADGYDVSEWRALP